MTARKTPNPVPRTLAEDIADIESMSDEEIDRLIEAAKEIAGG